MRKKFDDKDKSSTLKGKRSKRPNSSRRRNDRVKDEAKEAMANSTNDPAWYSTSPELLRDSASIPFSWPTGTSIGVGDYINHDRVPGVMTLGLKQVIGDSRSASSPASVAANAIYSFVRHANSGHSNYDANDLMLYLMGISSVYSFITWCQRLLGIVMTYDQRNRYLPDALIEANHVSPQSLRNNIANFRFWLNTFISKVASFAVPGVMPYFSRMAFLYSNYYIDGPSIKDQFYMYVPFHEEWLKFELDSETHLGTLVYDNIPFTGSTHTVDNIISFGEALFDAIWNQEDFGIMSGDILKAYGDNIIKLAPVPELLLLLPTYDAIFLHQFKNAKPIYWNALDISKISAEADGYIKQIVDFKSDYGNVDSYKALYSSRMILSTDFENPGPDVVIESTRLMSPYIENIEPGVSGFRTGSEIALRWEVIQFTDTDDLGVIDLWHFENIESWNNIDFEQKVNHLCMAKAFKYAPEIIIGLYTSTGLVDNGSYRCWDIDNYAVVDGHDLSKMHMSALMSMMAVPSIAKI